jgi:hypothetical protein
MSGSKYTVSCKHCNTLHEPRGKAMTLSLTCTSCGTYFRTGDWNQSTTQFEQKQDPTIPIGSTGHIENFKYEVMGFVVKEEVRYRYQWREYLLFNPLRGYAFLAEYNGHWNFIWPIENDPRDFTSDTSFESEGSHFDLYQKYTAKVVYAVGEFFFDVVDITDNTVNYEYIAPPYLMALEQSEDSTVWFRGEYFTPKEIASVFSIPKSQLPGTSGIGYTQPFNNHFSDRAMVVMTILFGVIMLVLHIMMNMSAEEAVVYQGEYKAPDIRPLAMFVTPSFDLRDGTDNLEVQISASLDNDWFFSEFTLINEVDGTEYDFTKEVEYYSGVEDGYSWSEGTQIGTAFLSSIPEGRYHINIYPEFSPKNDSFNIAIIREVPMYANFYVACCVLLLYPIGYFIRKHWRETSRWGDSEYSPYDTD